MNEDGGRPVQRGLTLLDIPWVEIGIAKADDAKLRHRARVSFRYDHSWLAGCGYRCFVLDGTGVTEAFQSCDQRAV